MSESNGYVTLEEMIAPSPRIYKDVTIANLGKVEIHTIYESERAEMEAPNYRKNGTVNVEKFGDARCRLCVIGTSKPQMTMQHVQYLRKKDQQIINDLAEAIAEHCGISKKDMEELEKKETTPAGS